MISPSENGAVLLGMSVDTHAAERAKLPFVLAAAKTYRKGLAYTNPQKCYAIPGPSRWS
jgi:hypothetical protein